MFTESIRITCSFPACHGESAKYQTCFPSRREVSKSLTVDSITSQHDKLGTHPYKL